MEQETNRAELQGRVLTVPVFSHRSYGENFYRLLLGVARKSGFIDRIPVIVSERILWNREPEEGDVIDIEGQIRTYNEPAGERSRLNIVVFARELSACPAGTEPDDRNQITLEGFICKPPVDRLSPLGRELCDIMLAVNRAYNKSDYIPCIAWGRNARYSGGLPVGTKLRIQGRIQSREYRKKLEDGTAETRIAYEVSVLHLETC
ncbi:MAG: single-stranded DNA-binding protein [Clostridiales bacterium]|nr:single-stranded DNA-binding protein [Clostridiales bacterium]